LCACAAWFRFVSSTGSDWLAERISDFLRQRPAVRAHRGVMSYAPMLRLFSYPDLYGVADNNPYGLKIYAFLKLCKLAFQHEHILDTKSAPRGQLPYLVDGEKTVGDSDAIISHLITRYALTIDDDLTANQRGHRSFGKTDARRSLLGHVLFALGRSPLLAAFPGSPSDDTSRHYRSSGTGVQFYALPLSRYWPLRARGSLCQRYRGT
jgi:hypothetical protein